MQSSAFTLCVTLLLLWFALLVRWFDYLVLYGSRFRPMHKLQFSFAVFELGVLGWFVLVVW